LDRINLGDDNSVATAEPEKHVSGCDVSPIGAFHPDKLPIPSKGSFPINASQIQRDAIRALSPASPTNLVEMPALGAHAQPSSQGDFRTVLKGASVRPKVV